MAYVPIPKDLTKVKTKVMFNLTKRQLICFGAGVLIGAPLFFLLMGPLGSSTAAMCMMVVMLPFFLLGVYEKNGQPLEKVAGHIIQASILRPRQRPYRTNNFYAVLERQYKLDTLGEVPTEIVGIDQVGVAVGLIDQHTEPGYMLADGTALLESEKDEAGFYVGGAGMDGMFLRTPARYEPVRDEDGVIYAFRRMSDYITAFTAGEQALICDYGMNTVTKILTLQEYCGDVLNFKTYSKSYKNKRRIENDRENWAIFKDVHEAIIDRATWEKIQERRGKVRKRRTHEGEKHMFSGLLVCAYCGSNLHFHFNQGNPEIEYFNCSNYKGNRGTCSSTHYIRADFLEQIVLAEITRLTRFVCHYEKEFAKLMMGFTQQAAENERKLIQKELDAAKARDRELDSLFERIYEDNVAGKLSDERFARMSVRYEDEQKELRAKIKTLQEGIERTKSKAVTADMFISSVRKYTRAKKLTLRMLDELVQYIEVHQAEKVNETWVQRLTIHYNCVGAITIPGALPLPVPDITVNTRKGVYVSYQPDMRAG